MLQKDRDSSTWTSGELGQSTQKSFILTLQVRQRNDIMANGMDNGVHAKYGTHHEQQVASFGIRKRDGLFDEVL